MNNIQPILKQLRESEARATKGEWFDHKTAVSTNPKDGGISYPPHDYSICSLNDMEYICNENIHDASLIVLMRNNLIPLLDYVEKLEKGIQETVKIGSMWATRAMDLGYDPEK